jgi:flagellar hook-basal body complex protein FliE
MNNQFATQFLREEVDHNWLENFMKEHGADETLIAYTMALIDQGLIKPERAIEIFKDTLGLQEDGGAAAPAGGSTTGGGVTNGASFTPGTGEQYAAGTKKVRKSLGEDAPRLAGEPSKTNSQGAKNLNAYKSAGFTKAPSAQEAGKKLKSIDVEELWEEEPLNENYFRFRNETKMRGKSEQFHEAVKIINKKLDEVNRLLEFTGTLKTELSEGEENFEVKTNTKKAMDKVRGKVVEAYQKLKQL